MRILRGKSDLEVSSQGFAWFVVGLVLATFIGGAVRTILSSDQVHKRIVSELKARFPKHEFTLGKTEVLLSSGLWPGLGLRVQNLSFKQETCDKLSFNLEVPEAILPVDMLSLRKRKVRLGRVELSKGRIHLNYRPCPPPAVAPVVEQTAEESQAAKISPPPKKPAIEAAHLNWRRAGEHMNAIELRDFIITYERNRTWKLSVKSMELEFGSTELTAAGLMEIHKSLPFGELTHAVDFEAHGDDNLLHWALQSEFKEGSIGLNGSLDLSSGAAIVQAGARQLPLKDVMSELYQMGFVEKDIHLKATWLSCGLKWEGQFSEPKTMPVKIQDCKLEGGYGRLELGRADLWLNQDQMFKEPAVIKVERMQIQPLLESINRKVLPAVLARPGVWSGEISFLSPRSWQLDGFLENAEVTFSNRSVRGKQMLERMRTRVAKNGNLLNGKIDELKIQGGEFEGVVQFQLQDDWRNGTFSADVQKLRFSSSIQNLLVGGTLGALTLKGEGSLQSGELGHWNGQFELGEIKGAGWGGTAMSVKSKYLPGVFTLDARAKEMFADETWPQFPQLKSVWPQAVSPVKWRDVQSKLDIQRSGGVIHSVTASETSKDQAWRFKGAWVRDGEFTGLLSVGLGSGARPKNFALRGEKGVLVVNDDPGAAR